MPYQTHRYYRAGRAHNDTPVANSAATAGLNITYTEPVRPVVGELRATAEVLYVAKRTVTVQARITDPTGRLYAFATATLVVGTARPAMEPARGG